MWHRIRPCKTASRIHSCYVLPLIVASIVYECFVFSAGGGRGWSWDLDLPASTSVSLWPPYGIGQAIIFLPCDFYLLSFFLFFSSPNLSGRRLDVCHTSTHDVALVRIYDAGLKPAAHGSLETQDAKKSPKIAIWALSHNFVGLYLRN